MLKIYGTKESEADLLAVLAEFSVNVFVNYPIKGRTRKVRAKRGRGANLYRVTNFPS